MDSNVSITEHGQFWLSENENRKLWGTLYVNEVNEATLETFGFLVDPSEGGSHTILGQMRSGQKWVTLISCIPTNTQESHGDGQTDWSHQTCLVNIVVEGIGFERGEEIAFEQASLDISTLPKWANPNMVKLAFAEDKSKPIRVNISIEDRADETTRVSFRGEEVIISVAFQPKERWGHHGAITKYQVEDHCYLKIERSDGSKMPLKSILSVAGTMLDLLSICCNETSTVASFTVHLEKGEPPPAKVYVRMRGYDSERKEGFPYAALRLTDLGGMGGVARWIEVTERYGAAVALLTSNWYNEKAYNEDKFSRMYTAVEGLLSRKKKRKRAKMTSKELADFVEDAIPSFSSITSRPSEEWAERVKDIRDQKISHSDPTSTVVTDGRTMHVMTNVLYTAGASFLLREMGIGEKQVEAYIERCSQSLLLRNYLKMASRHWRRNHRSAHASCSNPM